MLTLGIVLKQYDFSRSAPMLLIITGVICKVYYIIAKAKSGEYKPGIELIFLMIGLLLFLSGTYLKSHEPIFNPFFLIIPGILFKTLFIVLVILNLKKNRKKIKA